MASSFHIGQHRKVTIPLRSESQSCPTLCDPMDYTVHGILQATILESVSCSFSRGSSQPRDRTQVSCITANSLPAEPQGKPKNTGMDSLSLLQQIFLIQKSNRGLLHCKQILYQLSYQGSLGDCGVAILAKCITNVRLAIFVIKTYTRKRSKQSKAV